MGLSSATRRFKSMRLKKDRMPIGNVVDTAAAHTNYQSPPVEKAATAPAVKFPEPPQYNAARGPSLDAPAHLQQQHPPVLTSLPSDVDGRVAMAGSATQEDIVIYRMNSWKMLVKEFSDYFSAIVSAETAAKKALEKAMKEFEVPLKGNHCFAGIERPGVQQLASGLKDVHRMYVTQHSMVAQGIESDTLERLSTLRGEIKDSTKEYVDHLEPIYKKLRKQAKEVEECKVKLVHAVEEHKKKHREQDAWLAQQQLRRELTKQAELENAIFKAVQAERARLAKWEVSIAGRVRDILASALARERTGGQSKLDAVAHCLASLERFDASSETQAFDQHFGPVLQSPMGFTGTSSLADYDYMYRDSQPTTVLLEGALEREKGVIKKWQACYAVLTIQGHLHCFAEQRDLLEKNPDVSFHLADCSLVSMDDPRVFQIVVGDKKLGRSKYLFRASDAAYVGHWINAIGSVVAKAATPENHFVGGTLRNAKDAMDASAGAADQSTRALPTAAGVTVGELAARYIEEAEANVRKNEENSPDTKAASPVSPLDTPLGGDKFYAARDFGSGSIVAGADDHVSTFSAGKASDGTANAPPAAIGA
ncbi:hypothetical protein LPJ53_005638 [Coemansia erecta]|uniref:PH domain-containing protein n=1 Tax=Coemansia erecta TaxID=147472 RepID=A0A9W8CMY6_9FUNG|nr:hypothetical protein LPJ53_005638 [Coemansia erecta]